MRSRARSRCPTAEGAYFALMEPLKRTVDASFDEARERVIAALAQEGFGVLTRIDIKDTLEKKIGVDFRRYEILGACNPKLAHRALSANLEVGTLLPCNVVVYEDDDGKAVLWAIDPNAMLPGDAAELREVADEARARLARAIAGA